MALLPSGLDRKDVELIVIETAELSLYIKGRPFHDRYEGLKQYKSINQYQDQKMSFTYDYNGVNIQSVGVFDIHTGQLSTESVEGFSPIFFENGIYQLVVYSKEGKKLSFYHEHPSLRKSVGIVGKGQNQLLMGNLQFMNEVGFSTFEIRDGNKKLLEVTLEIFPTKLDYKEDYQRLLEEVNDEIYNLAYHFLRKTFLGATPVVVKNPSMVEFYRLFRHFIDRFFQAIDRIEQQPHHQLVKEYRHVRGDQIRKLDSYARKYLQKRPELFEQVPTGIKVDNQSLFPKRGLTVNKTHSFDNLENRFVKWMMTRLLDKVNDLNQQVKNPTGYYKKTQDEDLVAQIEKMQKRLLRRLKSPFWREIRSLDRSVISLVLQMKPGYRDAYMIFLLLSRGLTLEGQFTKMSVKDVATLYEYWTYLKIGQILSKKYNMISQNIVKVKREGLFVDLDQSKSAKRVFRHPQTGERIELFFQKNDRTLPTVSQQPDIVLSIAKNGKDFSFDYIFDAKYRVDFAVESSHYKTAYKSPGPLEEDINTMHRYRDALVVQQKGVDNYPYERYAYGAYILFPWYQEERYEGHRFYKSIDQVNVGGFPFLPNATRLVEQFVEHLVEKSPEEILEKGILPKGTVEHWQSSLDDLVLVCKVKDRNALHVFRKQVFYSIPVSSLKKSWQEAKYVALYIPQTISHAGGVNVGYENGITYYGKIKQVHFSKEGNRANTDHIRFDIESWEKLNQTIKPVNYGISLYTMTTLNTLKEARELPELFMKSTEEVTLWRMLRRISNKIKTHLNQRELDHASSVKDYQIKDLHIQLDKQNGRLLVLRDDVVVNDNELPIECLNTQPTRVFKEILHCLK